MSSQWFYVRDGKKHGPFSSAQLRDMAASGDLLPTDLIQKEGMSGGRKADDFPNFFENAVSSQTHEPQQRSPNVESPARDRFASFKEQARNAVHAAAVAAEKTKLLTITLPYAYVELGQHCFEKRNAEKYFPKEMADLDRLAVEDSKAFLAAAPASLIEWVKSIASKGIEVAQKQKAAVERNLMLSRLGKMAFGRFGESAGPPEITSLIANSLARVDEIDAQLAVSAGAVAGPKLSKKLLFGGLASAGCITVFVFGLGLISASRQRSDQAGTVVVGPQAVQISPKASGGPQNPEPSLKTVQEEDLENKTVASQHEHSGDGRITEEPLEQIFENGFAAGARFAAIQKINIASGANEKHLMSAVIEPTVEKWEDAFLQAKGQNNLVAASHFGGLVAGFWSSWGSEKF